jgi:hypothetical protein
VFGASSVFLAKSAALPRIRPRQNHLGLTLIVAAIIRVTPPGDHELFAGRVWIQPQQAPADFQESRSIRTFWESAGGRQVREELRRASQTLEISLTDMLVEESTPSEYRRVFAEIPHDPP